MPRINTSSADDGAKGPLLPSSPVPHRRRPSSDGEQVPKQGCQPLDECPAPSEPLNVTDTEAWATLLPLTAVPSVLSHTINAVREHHRERDDLLRTEGNMTRQIKGICRRAAGCSPTDPPEEKARKQKLADEMYRAVEAGEMTGAGVVVVPSTLRIKTGRDGITVGRKEAEKKLVNEAKKLPVAKFVEETRGFGWLGLGQIVGEAGNLSLYANPAKLWKRFGLGLISSGERQRKFADAAKAIEAGYSPKRRSLMFVLGDSMLKQQGPYRDLYLERKVYEEQKAPELFKMVWHMRAQRYMEKRLLRELWRAWRKDSIT